MKQIAAFILIICMTSCSTYEPPAGENFIQDNSEDPEGTLKFRNPYNIDNYLKSKHFAVLWGGGLRRDQVEYLLPILEENYRKFLEMGFLLPPTMETHKLNVYISGTGQVPKDDEEAGIAGRDIEGHEHFIMNKSILSDTKSKQQVTAHEYFHTIQYAYDVNNESYTQTPWLNESSAVWASNKAWPNNIRNIENALPSYAYYPQYSIDDHNLNGGDGNMYLLAGHHYGTFLFLEHLENRYNDDDFIRGFFEYLKNIQGDVSHKNVFEALREYAANTYSDIFSDSFHDFAVRNVTWEGYSQSPAVYNNAMLLFQNALNQRIAAEHFNINNVWSDAPSGIWPHRWGSNYIKFSNITSERLEVSFDGNPKGCFESEALWNVTVVLVQENETTNIHLELTNNEIQAFQFDTNNAHEIWLVISNGPESEFNSEEFAYRYQFAQSGLSKGMPSEDVACFN